MQPSAMVTPSPTIADADGDVDMFLLEAQLGITSPSFGDYYFTRGNDSSKLDLRGGYVAGAKQTTPRRKPKDLVYPTIEVAVSPSTKGSETDEADYDMEDESENDYDYDDDSIEDDKSHAHRGHGHYQSGTRLTRETSRNPNYSSNSNWDQYEEVPRHMQDYAKVIKRVSGYEEWNEEQRHLHKLIFLRGLHPVMPASWRWSFKMWGIAEGNLAQVFAPENSKKEVIIKSYGNELAACKALESVFLCTQHILDFERLGQREMMGPFTAKTIRSYWRWALKDSGLDKCKFPPLLLVLEYEYSRDKDFAHEVSVSVMKKVEDVAQRWREMLMDDETGEYVAEPPTIFVFTVVQHTLVLSTYDAAWPELGIVQIEEVKFNARGLWLWNSLTVAIAVHMARDTLVRARKYGFIREVRRRKAKKDPDY
ncbi:hypothetical protein B0T20DRAFT_350193 [Sordaria brevicollis]|uniref:Uncharacterized protein n=1 Tax=Sordaria brevicollis TaxID=83679 RepID=A0AAE0PHH2_SORBR|nr:hypothetical protein B0T20DRAFT_350193 [Sordaria brevicollis]